MQDEVTADANDDSADAKRRLRQFKRKRINENKLILEAMDRSIDGILPWSDSHEFSCFECGRNVTSVAGAMHHMIDVHPRDEKFVVNGDNSNDAQQQNTLYCILCPRSFSQLHFLKIHLWRHCNSVAPSTMKTSSPKTPTKSWAETQRWPCKRCLPGEVITTINYVSKHC